MAMKPPAGWATVPLKTLVAAVPIPLPALRVKLYVPPTVGVPVMAPVVVSNANPTGNEPAEIEYVGAGLPVADTPSSTRHRSGGAERLSVHAGAIETAR